MYLIVLYGIIFEQLVNIYSRKAIHLW